MSLVLVGVMMVTLTMPNGLKFLARADAITVIRPDPEGIYDGNSIIQIDTQIYGVMESVEEIGALIDDPLNRA